MTTAGRNGTTPGSSLGVDCNTPWWKLFWRMLSERRKGTPIRVQLRVGDEWFYLGGRR